MKYLVTLKSGRTLVMNSGYDVWQAAYDAYDTACEHDDYLVNVEPVEDSPFLTHEEEMEILFTL
jgi:hypothetical protein